MRVYLSGPIAGKPDKNKAAFAETVRWFTMHHPAHDPVNPHDVPPREHEGECPVSYYHDKTHSSACYLRTDLIALLNCDAVLMLEGWVKSRGANMEIQVAKMVGIPIYYSRSDFATFVKEKAAVAK